MMPIIQQTVAMRYEPEHKQKTHERVVKEAASAIRQFGPDKVGVAALMAKAGLTHGGFYAHFSSKDELVAEAIDYMFKERLAVLQRAQEANDPAEGLSQYIDLYLSPLHRDRRDRGCPVVALSGDVARMPASARDRFEAGLNAMSTLMTSIVKKMNITQPDLFAATLLFELVGALTIARSISDRPQSNAMLDLAKQSLKQKIGLRVASPDNT